MHTYINFFQNSKSGEGKAKYDSGNVSWSQWGHSRTAEKGQKYGCSSDLYCGHVHSLPESQNYPWHFWSLLLRPCKWHFSLPVSILFGNPHLCLSFDVGCQFSLQLSDLHAPGRQIQTILLSNILQMSVHKSKQEIKRSQQVIMSASKWNWFIFFLFQSCLNTSELV